MRGSRGRGRGRGQGSGTGSNNVPQCAIPISVPDVNATPSEEFNPLRNPGPHLPPSLPQDATELDLFHLFVDDEVLERLVTATNEYAEQKKDSKPTMYARFKRHTLTTDEVNRYLGCLILLSINSVRNYTKAWNRRSSQYLIKLHRLMTRDRFEDISAFLHVVTSSEEAQLSQHHAVEILPATTENVH